MSEVADFRVRLSALARTWPLRVARVCHGRDPVVGFDCVGLVVWAYKTCGLPIDELDVPYNASNEEWLRAQGTIARQLLRSFDEVPSAMVRTGVGQDGDIWLVGHAGDRHAAIRVGRTVWHMGDRMEPLPVTPATAVRVFRHRRLAC